MKKIMLAALVLFSSSAGAGLVDTSFTCDGGKSIAHRYDSLTVDGVTHAFIDSSQAAGQHENGENYPATAYEFDSGWILVLADGDMSAAVLAHEEDFWYCERDSRQQHGKPKKGGGF